MNTYDSFNDSLIINTNKASLRLELQDDINEILQKCVKTTFMSNSQYILIKNVIEHFQERAITYKNKSSNLEDQLNSNINTEHYYKHRYDKLKKSYDELKVSLENSSNMYDTLELEIQNANKKIESYQKEIEKLNGKITFLQSELINLKIDKDLLSKYELALYESRIRHVELFTKYLDLLEASKVILNCLNDKESNTTDKEKELDNSDIGTTIINDDNIDKNSITEEKISKKLQEIYNF